MPYGQGTSHNKILKCKSRQGKSKLLVLQFKALRNEGRTLENDRKLGNAQNWA